ncbi:MAG TPA: nitrate reductase molybdenum cofactor assembly chaperone [Pyrinomonadaceae bacterium]|nr:nitrate reductase molybdenum cofactor assembly chaperone [Pyrinomonadaceae bacterium]
MSEVTKDEEAAVKSIYEGLARLLDYPGADWNALVTSCAELLAGEKSEVAKSFGSFSDRVQTHSLSDLQELYTRTFDLNPVCAMEIGYHLFGENYKRGVFLANLRATEAPYGLGQEHQLPDYLPVLLRLLTKLDGKDEDLRASLIRECMGPAIEKMIDALKDSENPYRYVLQAVKQTLGSEAGIYHGDGRANGVRASLPILVNESRNNANEYEITQSRDLVTPELRAASCDFADRHAFNLNPNPDLF